MVREEFLQEGWKQQDTQPVRVQLPPHQLYVGRVCEQVQFCEERPELVGWYEARTLSVDPVEGLGGGVAGRWRAGQGAAGGEEDGEVGLAAQHPHRPGGALQSGAHLTVAQALQVGEEPNLVRGNNSVQFKVFIYEVSCI